MDIVPQPRHFRLRKHAHWVDRTDRLAGVVDGLPQTLDGQWRGIECAGGRPGGRGDSLQEVVNVVDGGVLGDHSLLLQLAGQLVEVGARSIGHVAYHRQQQHRRKVERRQPRHFHEITDCLAGGEIFDFRRSSGGLCPCPLDTADILGEEIEHLPDHDRVGLAVLECVRNQEASRLA